MSVNLSVTGLKEIDDLLKGLPRQLQHRVLQAAHADAAKPLIDFAQGYSPFKTGKLERSIGAIKPPIHKATEIGIVKIGPRRGGIYKGYHGHLIEYGHRIVTKKGKTVGKTRPKPFIEPAFNVTKKRVENNIADSIGKKLISFMKRTIKKYA
jgi:HK97 gp10 family phage protein